MSVTTAIVLDMRRTRKQSRNFPVCIRVTADRDFRRYPIGLEMTEKDFKKIFATNLGEESREKLREIKENLEKEELRAKSIIKNLRNFSFVAFKEEFSAFLPGSRKKAPKMADSVGAQSGATTKGHAPLREGAVMPTLSRSSNRVFTKNQFGKRKYPIVKSDIDFKALGQVAYYYGNYIIKLEAQERVGTVSCYMCSLFNLLEYKKNLRFADLTEMELYRYEKWMRAKGRSVTTISIYLRCLRHVFNTAIAKKVISRDDYPFGPEVYVIPSAKNVKKAIPIADVQRMYEYQSTDPKEMMGRDFWFFLYLGNGMNPKDMALLKYENVEEQFIRFIRAKTVNTTRENPIKISVFISGEVQRLIDRYGNPDKSPDNYIFPILAPGMDPYKVRHHVQLFIKGINNAMYGIAAKLGIVRKVSTMAARHSLATHLKRTGVNLEEIREMIGHATLRTTENYFDGFEDEAKVNLADKFLPFKKDTVSQAVK